MTKSKRKSKNINRNTYPWQDYINQTNNKRESTLYGNERKTQYL